MRTENLLSVFLHATQPSAWISLLRTVCQFVFQHSGLPSRSFNTRFSTALYSVIPYRLLQGLFARSAPYYVLNIEAPCHRRGLTLILSAGRLLLHLTLEGAGPLSPLHLSAGPWANNPTFSQSPDQGSTWPACQWTGLGCNLSVFTPLRPSCRVLYSNWTRNSHTLVSGAVASPPPSK